MKFITLHEGASPVRVNAFNVVWYKPRQHGQGTNVLCIGSGMLMVEETPDAIDKLLGMGDVSDK